MIPSDNTRRQMAALMAQYFDKLTAEQPICEYYTHKWWYRLHRKIIKLNTLHQITVTTFRTSIALLITLVLLATAVLADHHQYVLPIGLTIIAITTIIGTMLSGTDYLIWHKYANVHYDKNQCTKFIGWLVSDSDTLIQGMRQQDLKFESGVEFQLLKSRSGMELLLWREKPQNFTERFTNTWRTFKVIQNEPSPPKTLPGAAYIPGVHDC